MTSKLDTAGLVKRYDYAVLEGGVTMIPCAFGGWVRFTDFETITQASAPGTLPMPVFDALAQEIRRVDGDHSLGAAALAEALAPFLASQLSALQERVERAERERDEAQEGLRLARVWDFPSDIQDLTVRLEAAEEHVAELEDEPYAYEYHRSNGDGTNSPTIERTVRNPSPEWPVVPLYRKKGSTDGN